MQRGLPHVQPPQFHHFCTQNLPHGHETILENSHIFMNLNNCGSICSHVLSSAHLHHLYMVALSHLYRLAQQPLTLCQHLVSIAQLQYAPQNDHSVSKVTISNNSWFSDIIILMYSSNSNYICTDILFLRENIEDICHTILALEFHSCTN